MKSVVWVAWAASLLISSSCIAAERLVPAQYPTLSAAIGAAVSGDTIVVSPGRYFGYGNTNLNVLAKRLTIRSTDPTNPDVVADTIIDCRLQMPGGTFAFRLDNNAVLTLEGLTIFGGRSNQGGAIDCRNSMLFAKHCVFEYCYAQITGGSVYASNSVAVFSNCDFYQSISTLDGAAVYASNSEVTLNDCVVEDCFVSSSSVNGGMIYATSNSKLTLTRCDLKNNWSMGICSAVMLGYGEGVIIDSKITGNIAFGMLNRATVMAESSTPLTIINSILSDNYDIAVYASKLSMDRCKIIANKGTGLVINADSVIKNSLIAGNYSSNMDSAGILISRPAVCIIEGCTVAANYSDRGRTSGIYNNYNYNSVLLMKNCIVWGNRHGDIGGNIRPPSEISYCNGFVSQYGDWASYDPQFVQNGAWVNGLYIEGDYRLSYNSPCINGGDPNMMLPSDAQDLAGQPRVHYGRIDMGAYELPPHPMDFDKNGRVGLEDFAEFAENWLWQIPSRR